MLQVGAGVSTAAGIPDFRSPDTGLYANLARLNLPYPEAVFDISYFRNNPHPFYALARELYPGSHKPTLAHTFINLLYQKGRLLKCFTQNIDCLERETGLPANMIVEAHGSFATSSCIDCKEPFPEKKMREAIRTEEVPRCPNCTGLTKPDIVFFGEALPPDFFDNRTLLDTADLCIVMGTSLTVQPFASLPYFCRENCPRVLINLTKAGDLGHRRDDVVMLMDCDAGVAQLADALGWRDELNRMFEQVNPEKVAEAKETAQKRVFSELKEECNREERDEQLHGEIDKLTAEVDESLHVSRSHERWIRDELAREPGEFRGRIQSNGQDNKQEEGQERAKGNEPAESQDAANRSTTPSEAERRPVAPGAKSLPDERL